MTKRRRTVEEEENVKAKELKVRFHYENGLNGEWVNLLDAVRNGFITPNKLTHVNRLDIELEERASRKVANVK